MWTYITYSSSPFPLFLHLPDVQEWLFLFWLLLTILISASGRAEGRQSKSSGEGFESWGKAWLPGAGYLCLVTVCRDAVLFGNDFFSPSALQSYRSFEFTLSFPFRRQKGRSRTWNETDAYGIVVLKAFFSWVLSFSTQSSPMWAD